MAKRRLPIGMQTFRELRELDCYYVDKTAYIERLFSVGKHYFLSRPRRFGKSLFLDTLKELFEGNEPLFRGLHIHESWEWSKRHPVVRMSFGSADFKEPGTLHEDVMLQLEDLEVDAEIEPRAVSAPARTSPSTGAIRRSAGTPSGIWTRCSRRSLPAWIGSRCGSGTTATAGAARRRCITRTTCC